MAFPQVVALLIAKLPEVWALGALELRALGALAAADLVPPLRFRPVRKVTREVVAL